MVQNRKRSVFQRSARIVAVSSQQTSQASLAVSIRALRERRSVCGSVRLVDQFARCSNAPNPITSTIIIVLGFCLLLVYSLSGCRYPGP